MKKRKALVYLAVGFVIFGILFALRGTSYFLNASNFIMAVVLFYFIDLVFQLKFKNSHYIIFLIVSTFGLLFNQFYSMYAWYDKILHFASPVLLCILVFFLVNKDYTLSFPMKLFLTVSVIISLLTFWEITEFSVDKILGYQTQGVYVTDPLSPNGMSEFMNPITDTMTDLIMGTLGCICFVTSQVAFAYYRRLQIFKRMSLPFINES
jgi:hypothetical protein